MESYIDQHYVERQETRERKTLDVEREFCMDEEVDKYNEHLLANAQSFIMDGSKPIEDLVANLDEPFSEFLLRYRC